MFSKFYAFTLGVIERNAAFGTHFAHPVMRRAYLKGRYFTWSALK